MTPIAQDWAAMRLALQFLAVLAALLLPSSATAQAAPPAFSMDMNTFRFEPGNGRQTENFLLTLTGTGAQEPCSLALQPLDPADPGTWEIKLVKGAETRSTSRSWLVTLQIDRARQTAAAATRRFVASCGAVREVLKYTIDTSPVGQFAWRVTPIPEQRWDGVRPLALRVFVGARAATGVELLAPDVVEPHGLRAITTQFNLCKTRDNCTDVPLNLEANRAHTLWIQPVEGKGPAPGDYAANFVLVAAEAPGGTDISTRLHISDDRLRWVGAFLVLLGVALAFLVTRVLRGLFDRAALLRPATLLVDQLSELEVERRKYQGKLQFFDNAIDTLWADLAASNLKKYLPRLFDAFAPPAGVPRTGPDYQALLTSVGERIGGLRIIISSGVQRAAQKLHSGLSAPDAEIVERAIGDLDALSEAIATREATAASVRQIIQKMEGDLTKALDLEADASGGRAVMVGYSSESVAFQSTIVNLAGWLAFTILTAMVGIWVLVLRDNDFGQTEDLLLCLLWGFGLPAGAQGLSGLGATTVGNSLGVTLTRNAT